MEDEKIKEAEELIRKLAKEHGVYLADEMYLRFGEKGCEILSNFFNCVGGIMDSIPNQLMPMLDGFMERYLTDENFRDQSIRMIEFQSALFVGALKTAVEKTISELPEEHAQAVKDRLAKEEPVQ